MKLPHVNPENVPPALKKSPQWVCWEPRKRGSKMTKVPIKPSNGTANARINSADSWGSFQAALSTAKKKKLGIGFVFTAEDPFVGVDLDKCRDLETGQLEKWAADIVDRFDSYTEVSPSGLGVHIIIRGQLPEGRRKSGPLELYDQGRYFTVTGQRLENYSHRIESRQTELEAFHTDAFGGASAKRRQGKLGQISDQQILEKARTAKNGDKFSRLWAGDISEQRSESEADLALCSILAFWTGKHKERIDRLFRGSALYRPKWDERRGALTYGELTIDKACESTPNTYSARVSMTRSPPISQAGKPIIIVDGELPRMVEEGIDALQTADLGVFQRGGELVRIRPGIGDEAPQIESLPEANLRELLAQAAEWLRRGKDDDTVVCPPTNVVQAIRARAEWPFPLLKGVTETPFLRPDGSCFSEAGYDKITNQFLSTKEKFPAIPAAVSKPKLQEAVKRLLEPFTDFPVKEPSDRSVILAAILTLVGRSAFSGPAPMFIVRAPERGTGKSLLIDAIATLATGRPAPRMPPGKNDEEDRKRIFALLLAGFSVAFIDNVERPLGSDALATVITAKRFQDRVLGASRVVSVPASTTWFASGNNLQIIGDLSRRVVPIDLDAKLERPEDRTNFKQPGGKLLDWIGEHRNDLVAAALTILRTFQAEGRPRQKNSSSFGSFEEWEKLIRQAVLWLDFEDPLSGRVQLRIEADPELEAFGSLIDTWLDTIEESGVLASELLKVAEGNAGLRESLSVLSKTREDKLDARTIGYTLRRLNGRIHKGYRLGSPGSSRQGRMWSVSRTSPALSDDKS